ncbi:MAG: hypothetical protein ACLP8A_08695 [Methylovirgula sp.]
MRLLSAILTALSGIVIGYCLTASIGYGIAGMAGMSDFEGGRAMFAGFFLGPIGAVVGLCGGAVFGWWLGGRPSRARRLVPLAVICLCAAGLAWQFCVSG